MNITIRNYILKLVLGGIAICLVSQCGVNGPRPQDNPVVPNGPGSEPQSVGGAFSGQPYLWVDKGTLEEVGSGVQGVGSLVFKDPIVREDNNFALQFLLESGGALTLITHSDNQLKKGVELSFERQGARLRVGITAKNESFDVSQDFLGVSGGGILLLEMDVHGHGHLIVDGAGEDSLEYVFPKGNYGNLWGLRLDKVRVESARIGKAKHVD